MKCLGQIAVMLAVLGLPIVTAADDKEDPTGTWTWRFINQSAVHTLKLELDGDKLTGSIKNFASQQESPIEDAAYKNGVVNFKHTYKARDGTKSVASYKGTVSGDTIKGSIEFSHVDRTISRDWEATRIK